MQLLLLLFECDDYYYYFFIIIIIIIIIIFIIIIIIRKLFAVFRVERQKLLVASGYPGLAVEYSTDCGATWQLTDGTERVTESQNVLLRSR